MAGAMVPLPETEVFMSNLHTPADSRREADVAGKNKLEIGDRVRTSAEVELPPHGVFPAGLGGVIVGMDQEFGCEIPVVKFDSGEHEFPLYPECIQGFGFRVSDFELVCAYRNILAP